MINQGRLIKIINAKTNWNIKPITFWTWKKKFNFIKPAYVGGSTTLYTENQIDEIIAKLKKLNNSGKINLKVKIK